MSSFTTTLVLAEFPATSVDIPETVWPAVSVETVTGLGQDATPLKASLQVKVTVTAWLFQPAAFGTWLKS